MFPSNQTLTFLDSKEYLPHDFDSDIIKINVNVDKPTILYQFNIREMIL